MSRLIDMTGQVYGRLTVLSLARGGSVRLKWKCRCECGQTVFVRRLCLIRGDTRSCGCLAKELASTRQTTHGQSESRMYRTWRHIKSRCYLKSVKSYPRYGGRGITMSDEWRNSFEAFRDWALANGYADDLEIDRIDNNGNYEPSNCQWSTRKEQMQNTRKSIYVMLKGVRMTVTAACAAAGVSEQMVRSRIGRGVDPQEAFDTPKKQRWSRHRKKVPVPSQ